MRSFNSNGAARWDTQRADGVASVTAVNLLNKRKGKFLVGSVGAANVIDIDAEPSVDSIGCNVYWANCSLLALVHDAAAGIRGKSTSRSARVYQRVEIF